MKAGPMLAVAAIAAAPALGVTAQVEHFKLLQWDTTGYASFGRTVGVSGDVAVVGAGDTWAGAPGGAYVFRYEGTRWRPEAKLLAGAGVGQLAVSGNVVTACGTGAVYVFRHEGSTWVEEARLPGADSVAVWGEVAVLGTPDADDWGTRTGAAYVFRHDGTAWREEARLVASDGKAYDEFGRSVAVSDGLVVVGASGDREAGDRRGSAYVFRFDGSRWVEEAVLTPSDQRIDDGFGSAVAAAGDLVLVGAPHDTFYPTEPGAAYAYRFDGSRWVEEVKLFDPLGRPDDDFGGSVALSPGLALIGARGVDDRGDGSGAAYVYRFDGSAWAAGPKLLASGGLYGDGLGISVALSGSVALVGAPSGVFMNVQPNPSAAYVYDLARPPAPSVSIEDAVVTEGSGLGQWMSFRVSLSGPQPGWTSVWYSTQDGSATAFTDYWPSWRVLLFPPGATTRRVWVWVWGDVVPETPEYFVITLAAPWGLVVGDKYGFGVIVDDD